MPARSLGLCCRVGTIGPQKGLSVRQLEEIVRKQRSDIENPIPTAMAPVAKSKDPDTLAVEKQMTELLACRCD